MSCGTWNKRRERKYRTLREWPVQRFTRTTCTFVLFCFDFWRRRRCHRRALVDVHNRIFIVATIGNRFQRWILPNYYYELNEFNWEGARGRSMLWFILLPIMRFMCATNDSVISWQAIEEFAFVSCEENANAMKKKRKKNFSRNRKWLVYQSCLDCDRKSFTYLWFKLSVFRPT